MATPGKNTVTTSGAAREAAQRAHGELRRTIVESLLKDILDGKLAAGERLVTESMATRFGVSHTPIREAFGTLAGMGVVELAANKGAVVKKLSPGYVREIMYVRAVLEAEAIRTACGRVPQSELLDLRAAFDRLSQIKGEPGPQDVVDAQHADTRLHTTVRAHTTNEFLRNELDRLMAFVRIIRDAAWARLAEQRDLKRVAEESAEHLAIVEALLDNDPDAASEAMLTHLRAGAAYVSRAV
ncbi:MAG: GntR family transcriptional regulator [Lacipirellulaceae bacterium]